MEPVVLTDSIGGALLDRLVPENRSHSYCEHLHAMTRPAFFVTAAIPGAFFCVDCIRSHFIAARVLKHDENQACCDVCLRQAVPGGLHPIAVTAGRATLLGSICDSCLHAMDRSCRDASRVSDEDPEMILTPRRRPI